MGIGAWRRRRWAFIRHFRVVPGRSLVVLVMALLAAALASPAMALVTGLLVARTSHVARGASVDVLVIPLALAALVITYQLMVDVVTVPIRTRIARLVDGAVQHRVRVALAAPPGIDHLEDQSHRALAKLPTSGPTSIGRALEAQVQVVFRYAGAAVSALIVASIAPLLAVGAFVVIVAKRLYLRRLYAPALSDNAASYMPQILASRYWYAIGGTMYGAKEIRVFGFEPTVRKRFDESGRAWAEAYSAAWKRAARAAWPAWIADAVVVGGASFVLANRVLDGDMSVARLAMAVGGLLGVLVIGGVGNETYYVEAALDSASALDDLERLSSLALVHAPARTATSSRPPLIEFEDVSFAYPGKPTPVFEHLSLLLEPCESVAIVGENGVGKTTLIKLLARFYDPTRGRILADGVDIRDLPVEAWRTRLAVVLQDFKRFPLSVRWNVALADPSLEEGDDAVLRAIEAAGAREVVTSLAHGLDTILSRDFRGGTELSGGQWQRIALARALYAAGSGAQMLVLDEPTAHLDVSAEVALFDQLLTHAQGTTAIVVSHRFSTVRRAERIVVLGEGRVIEDGAHQALIAAAGTYARLYSLQADAFVGGEQ